MGNTMVLLRSTYGSEADAKAAAGHLIDKRVAACVHVQAIWSTYRWKGKVEQDSEWLLEARTPVEQRDACWAALLDKHPYDNPLVEVSGESTVPARYAEWAKRCVAGEP